MKPAGTLSFLLLVFVMLVGLMAFLPKDGIPWIKDSKLVFPTLAEFFIPDTTVNRDVQLILADTAEIAEAVVDTSHLATQRDSIRREQRRIHFPPGQSNPLESFFSSLSGASSGTVRVMHYGDSQIEGDRITGPLRDRLQDKFGAAGPGLFPAVPVAPKLYVDLVYEGNWSRHAGFGAKDTMIEHKNYGALVSFARYAPVRRDTLKPDTAYQAAVLIKSLRRGYAGTRSFSTLKLHWGNTRKPVKVTVTANGETLPEVTLAPGVSYKVEQFDIPDNAEQIRVAFSGGDSPDIYAFALEGNRGVIVDNIPFRGGSGTELSKVAHGHLSTMLTRLSPNLFILEFGGNVLPYIDEEKEAASYARWFGSQIRMLKRIVPDASVIVIGPADMSVKDKADYVTHPFLEQVRDALKSASFEQGAAFWDMYGAMGGKNSMPAWVKTNPPMAASDYIHFSPKGASYIARLFSDALMAEYEKWKKEKHDTAVSQ